MGLRTLVAFTVTTLIIAKVSGSVPEDGNSVAEWGQNMNEKFLELFQRLDRLEAKVDRMAGHKDGNHGKLRSRRAVGLNQSGTELPDKVTVEPFHGSNETKTEEHLNEVQRLKNILSALVTVPACQRNAAHLPQPVVVAPVNTSQNLSCETKGEPLAACLWGRSVEGTRDFILIDRQVVQNDGRTAGEGVNYAGNSADFDAGKCAVNINSVSKKDAGLWSCNLVTRNSTVFSGAVHLALASDDGTRMIGTKRTGVKCEDSQTDFLMILEEVFEEGQHCAPCPDCDKTAKGKLAEAEAKLQRKEKSYEDLIAAFATPSSRIRPACVQRQTVFALVNTSATISCGSSDGKEWSLCTWEKKMHGKAKLVVIDQEVAQNDGQTFVDGISYVDTRQNDIETCKITVQSVTPQHFGQWSCTLLSRNGSISKGKLLLQEKLEGRIYFATYAQGVSAFSLETNQVMKTVSSGETLNGITFDSIANKLYWSSYDGNFYRANMDGSSVETVLSTSIYGDIRGLAFDWIGGNIYVVTSYGYILACGAGTSRAFNCYTVLDGQSDAYGISLHPTEGIMYWTRGSAGSIHKAGMDGSSPVTLVSGLGYPKGVTIDFASQGLYWTEYNSRKIQSSNLDGRDVRLVVQLPSDSYPWGIAVLNNRIYWGNKGNNKLQSCKKDGQDVQTLYTENGSIRHITIVPTPDQPSSRKNDCEGRNCSKLCVLSPSSYRCLT